MKCPKCGGETDGKKNYCSLCGGELRPRDNSADDTVRLPDLSGVPTGPTNVRRRESGGKNRSGGRGLRITLLVCVLMIAAALAVCLALFIADGRDRREPAPPEEGGYYDAGDNYEPEPYAGEEEPRQEEPDEEPQEPENQVIAEEEPQPEETKPEETPEDGSQPEESQPEEPPAGDEPEEGGAGEAEPVDEPPAQPEEVPAAETVE